MKDAARTELLKDRRAYRATLIQRQAELERKLADVETEIARLTERRK